MSIVTSQQLTRYYEQYKDVTFNKEVTTAAGPGGKRRVPQDTGSASACMVFSSSPPPLA